MRGNKGSSSMAVWISWGGEVMAGVGKQEKWCVS